MQFAVASLEDMLILPIYLNIFFYSASHPEIYFYYTAIIPAAPQETVGNAGIEPGTAALQSGVTLLT
jgi:hypothetical protein